ncbi:branched-subunit amino acid aminotransferase/4-amino-4-deoxychorismate lyase [Kribbella voronezhensis]|uniref:Branched-subunit amino acid aminotransferase/4-amino-4-deoxychorismate lyase n=1 Tax=Kribbella voronezhensis TaxID=2512212 RepID=A0A4V3FKF1_9ACTN|nr:aminotransferase class IV [Kribbella voronezhensis]TDU89893.1 branched-subunit amino acid aminotransferase/4-amino-4-deoxychorismate lyase [Kribbella voronezhensis]
MTENLELNGVPLESLPATLLRATSYGHFTSLQVRDGRVRGLAQHLERLDRSSRELFGHGLSADRVLETLRAALDRAWSADVSVRINAFSQAGTGKPVEPDLLVTVSDPVAPTTTPPRLLAFEHERPVPHLKHTGTFSLTYYARQARLASYDDALFYDRSGNVSEASIWNICFAMADRIIWPEAAVLPGITMLTLQAGLETLGVARETVPVPLGTVADYGAAYLTNSIDPALPVASITTPAGTTQYKPDPASADLIARGYAAIPLDVI